MSGTMYEIQEGRRGEGANQDKVNSKWRKQRTRQQHQGNLDQDNKKLDLQNHLCSVHEYQESGLPYQHSIYKYEEN